MTHRPKATRRHRRQETEAARQTRAEAQVLARAARRQRRIRDLCRALDRAIDAADRATYAVSVTITARRDALLARSSGQEPASGPRPSLRQAVS